MNIEFVKELDSTNLWLRNRMKQADLSEFFVVRTDYQSAGKGQANNFWESEPSKNLLFSTLLLPVHLPIAQQFLISQIVSVALCRTLERFVEDVRIKWPNDIYVGNKKIAGILIENAWLGDRVQSSIVGVGLNVNQIHFQSNAPNPTSLKIVTNKSFDRLKLLKQILEHLFKIYNEEELIELEYFERLFRKDGFYTYQDNEGCFEAKIADVKSDGQIELETPSGHRKSYYFKEVEFVL